MLSILQTNQSNKPYVQFVTSGFSGCRAFRCSFVADALNWVEGIGTKVIEVPYPILDNSFLNATKAILFKSPVNKVCYEQLVKPLADVKAKMGLKLLADYDDIPCYIDGEVTLPWHPWGGEVRKPEEDEWFLKMAPLFDHILVTNEYMARKLNERTHTNNYVIVPNTVPRFLFSSPRKPAITEDKKVFHIVGTGCPLHSLGPHKDADGKDVPGQPGDWASAEWVEFLKRGVTDGYIRYTQMGNQNWLLKDIQDKIQTVPWVPPLRYGSLLARLNPDICIAPLVPCVFNRCKSDLRGIECQITSSVLMGSSFEEGPYERYPELCKIPQGYTADQLKDRLFEIGQKDNWNSIVDWGWKDLLDNGRITESDQALERYVTLFGSTPKNIVPFDIL